MTILKNVVFAYVKMQNPVKGYETEDTEFTVDAVVSKADAKGWNKEHPKNKAKEYDTEEFGEKFKFEPPYPEQDSQYVIKFKKAHTKKGVELPAKFRPRVFEPVEGGRPKDITFEKLIGNGSKGDVSFSTFENSFGEFVQLDAILVQELIEYENSGATPGAEFGATDLAEVPKNQKPVQRQGETESEDTPATPKKTSKTKNIGTVNNPPNPPQAKTNFSDMDDDIPF